MIPTLPLLALLAAPGVDMTLTPPVQSVPPGCYADVDLVLSTAVATEVAAVDVILSWDPTKLTLIEPFPSSEDWFVAAFLNDPDGINDDVTDGEALFTALATVSNPLVPTPDALVATFRFQVIDDGQVSMLPTAGAFAETQVVGTVPGVLVTGTLGPAVTILANHVPAVESLRAGLPPNPVAFLPAVTQPPVIGQFWDPYIDHTTFFPTAIIDGFFLSIGAVNIELPPYGTLLCNLPWIGHPWLTAPGVPFSIYLPNDCGLVGAGFCSQGFSVDMFGTALATNAIDVTIGSI